MTIDEQILVTITGPSGSGKTELINALSKTGAYGRLISVTTREPRAGEVDGDAYYFITQEEFNTLKADDNLIQSVVFNGVSYGTTKAELERVFEEGKIPIVIVEPTGLPQFSWVCRLHELSMYSVYVSASEGRLVQRYIDRINEEATPQRLQYHAKRIFSLTKEVAWNKYWAYNISLHNDTDNLSDVIGLAETVNSSVMMIRTAKQRAAERQAAEKQQEREINDGKS